MGPVCQTCHGGHRLHDCLTDKSEIIREAARKTLVRLGEEVIIESEATNLNRQLVLNAYTLYL